LVLAILEAFHELKSAIDDVQVLVDLALSNTSIPADLTRKFLEDVTLATEDVKEEAMENEGPQGVPYFIFGRKGQSRRKVVLSGPQSPSTLIEAMKNLLL
jgi:predicted DsbA family dithiol-disulfide isomerase